MNIPLAHDQSAADARLIEAVDLWIWLMQPQMATRKEVKQREAQEREARSRLAYAAAEWAASHRDPFAAIKAMDALNRPVTP